MNKRQQKGGDLQWKAEMEAEKKKSEGGG